MTAIDTRTTATTALSKVPEVSAAFWLTKILTTGMGETTSDFLANTITPPVAVLVAGGGLYWTMRRQFRADRYDAWTYWAAIVMVSVFGTMVADGIHIVGVPYAFSTAFFVLALAAVFVRWRQVEGTLSIHSITTVRRERFYWATVLGTFALGTALGDLTASTLGLGYLTASVIFAVVISLPALGYALRKLNPVVAFWSAYVVTRPLGASVADWMGVSHARKGLAWGTGPVSLVLAVVIAALVAYLAKRQKQELADLRAAALQEA